MFEPRIFLHPFMITQSDAATFLTSLPDNSIDLLLIDPPYFGIVCDDWDNQWDTAAQYVDWLTSILWLAHSKVKPTGSLICFQALGKHGIHPIFDLVKNLERLWFFRDWITWKKRRAYGKKNSYLYTREEILWFSKDPKIWTFNIPLLDEKRGYAGFNSKYPAKSEFKRVSNVWADIPELMRPRRSCEKPIKLISRLIETHSNPGDLVVDCFAGTGSTEVSAVLLGRRFMGCDVELWKNN